jgi:hypothetical protein
MRTKLLLLATAVIGGACLASAHEPPAFEALLAHPVALRPGLEGVHPRVFVTRAGLDELRKRARTTHREEWQRVLASLPALQGAPPPAPGPQARRGQNNAAYAIAGAALAYAVEGRPEYLAAARRFTLAAIDYEPWGYTYNKPNVDLAAGHLLYAIGWAYDLLYDELTPAERDRIRASLTRHARLVYDHFAPGPGKRFNFTQNHDFIPTAGLGVAALALLGEVDDAPRWAALARAHHHRAGQLLSPDGYYYESFEYWIFSAPWLVHFLDAWEHATGESLWSAPLFASWKHYVAHSVLPDGRNVFDFGDIWEGPLTRAASGADYTRVYPGGTLQSNYNVLYRVAARLRDPETQAVAERLRGFGHTNLEEYWTLFWRNPELKPAPISSLPLRHHFEDMGVVLGRTSWDADAVAYGVKAGPPEGHRVAGLLAKVPEWKLDSGHAHPDAGSFVLYAGGRYLVGDTGYAGLPSSRNHGTLTFDGIGQGVEGQHDVWRGMRYAALDGIRIREVAPDGPGLRVVAELAAAYPEAAAVRRATRGFRFDGKDGFRVTDEVELTAPRTVEWRLQSDLPFEARGDAFVTGGPLGPALALRFEASERPGVSLGFSRVKSPGPPGAIETGPEEERGYQLIAATAPKVTSAAFDVRLTVEPPAVR